MADSPQRRTEVEFSASGRSLPPGGAAARALWLTALSPLVLFAQAGAVAVLGQPILFLPPAIDATGQTVVFGSAIASGGATDSATDLYVAAANGSGLRRLTSLPGSGSNPAGAGAVSLSDDGTTAAYALLPAVSGGSEAIHAVDIATGRDVAAAVYSLGCVQPLCIPCFTSCVRTVQASSDGTKVLYSVSNSPPFYVADATGNGQFALPVYTGSLAPSPARVVSTGGLVVFTSNQAFGPSTAAGATNVYLMNLDGTSIRAITNFGSNASISSQNATISADGSTIAFETNYPGGATSQVWVVGADGSNLRKLTSGADLPTSFSLSGDGTQLAMVLDGQLSILPTSGLGPIRLLAKFQSSSVEDAALSDDGSRVVFDIGPPGGGVGAIYSVGGNGGDMASVYAPRSLNPQGIVSAAAGGIAGSVAPGGLMTAYGTNLAADGVTAAQSFPLPQSLAGVSLAVNGSAVPLVAVTPWQLNAQIPQSVPAATASFQLQFADGTKASAVSATIQSVAPGIFSSPVTALDGTTQYWQAAVLHAGTGALADDADPAVGGEAVEIYGTGLGVTNPVVQGGTASPSPAAVTAISPQVLIGGKSATVVFSGLTPGFAGLYQVNAVVPSGLLPGRTSVNWVVGSGSGNSIGTMTIGEGTIVPPAGGSLLLK